MTLFSCILSCTTAPISASANYCQFNLFEGLLSGLWPLLGHDYRNSGVNPLEFKINRQNVNTLTKEWDYKLAGPGVSSQPTYSQGIAYFADSRGTVHAVNVQNGQSVWNTTITGQNFFTSPSISEDKIYIASSSLHALDKNTGAVLWSTPLYEEGKFSNEYPGNTTVVDGLVIVGVGCFVFDLKNNGRLFGIDKDTGEKRWVIATASDQFEPNPQYGPGVGIWSCPAIDRVRKLAFIGTGQTYLGNPSPLTDSLLAVNYCTGELVWSYSLKSDDVWNPADGIPATGPGTFDLDVSVPPNLFTAWTPQLGLIDLVGIASKGGRYLIFKRSQSNTNNVQPLVDIQLDPGCSVGAIQSTPVVNDGVLYISSVAYIGPNGDRRSIDEIFITGVSPQELYFAALSLGSIKTVALDIRKLLLAGNTHGTVPQNAVIWENLTTGLQGRNPLSLANGVLYQTAQSGFLRALDKDTGDELWRTIPLPPTPFFPIPGVLAAGVTVVNGKVLLSYGFDPSGTFPTDGGLCSYTLPGVAFHIEDEINP